MFHECWRILFMQVQVRISSLWHSKRRATNTRSKTDSGCRTLIILNYSNIFLGQRLVLACDIAPLNLVSTRLFAVYTGLVQE